jgi:putative glutamine amidotransferase
VQKGSSKVSIEIDDRGKASPLIGITMRYEPATERFYLARYYAEAVRAAGGIPIHIPLIPEAGFLHDLVSRLDGVLLPGSDSDVDPRLYNREPHRHLGSVHSLRDATDGMVLSVVEENRIPLLAICYGMQRWNVARGGTLIQDIASEIPAAIKHEQGAPRERRSHKVRLAGESIVAAAHHHGQAEVYVNSHHHQAIDRIGENLRATAWAADGLVEALEDTRAGRWAVGVQWHPEIDWEQDADARALFSRFVQASQTQIDLRKDKPDSYSLSVR